MRAKILLILVFASLMTWGSAQTISDKIIHKVEAGQTLYFLSKKYNIGIDQLRQANPDILDDLIIKPAQALVIPVENKTVELDQGGYKIHVVKTKETLYSLSKLYDISVSELINLNQLESANISIGQELKVGKLQVNDDAIFEKSANDIEIIEEKLEEKTEEDKNQVNQAKDVMLYKQLFESYDNGVNQLNKDKGIGNYLDGNSSGAYLAMVNNVPAEQIVKVRNLMNNKVIYLKVVGPVSSKDADKNIAIKISKSAAEDLNIIEDRFLAEWTWYTIQSKNENTIETPSTTFDDF
jgi:LysM repeat protein